MTLSRLRLAVGRTLTVLGFAGAVLVVLLVGRARQWSALEPGLLPLPWLVAGALALRARPDHPGALLFTGFGAGHLIAFGLTQQLALDRSSAGWEAWTLDLVAAVAYFAGFASLGCFLATYPSGVPQGRFARWFVYGWFPLTAVSAVVVQLTSDPVHLVASGVRDTIPAPRGLPLVTTGFPFVVIGPFAILIGAALLIGRVRRADGDERRQLSWAVGAAGLLALMLVVDPALTRLLPTLETPLFLTVVSVLPFVLLAGLVRFRLLDVDLYVARTLARGVVVAVVLIAYAVLAAVAEAQAVAWAAGLTVAAAVTAGPLVEWLERGVDRLLSGGRVRGQELMRQLAEELAVPSRHDQAVRTADTVQTSLDAAWVRVRSDGLAVSAGEPTGEPALVVPLLAGDLDVGRLEAGPRHGGWGPVESDELALLARHAGLALHSAQLTNRLEEQVRALAASRRRIVQADLAARKRLERDLHDGVQQQVIAMISHVGALRVLLPTASREAAVALTILDQARATLIELRQLVDGVQPPVLLDQGLVAAVESRSARLPVPVQIHAAESGRRWPQDVEAAAYYVVSEALTNVVKHAHATLVSVEVCGDADRLTVRVRDDGSGMPTEVAGSGLAGLRDRVEALGGALTVETGPGGTTVIVGLPS